MSSLSLIHVFAALIAALVGVVVFALRKGDRRHRTLGWTYVCLMSVGLLAILISGTQHGLRPFHVYALIIALAVSAAVLVSRYRQSIPGWRAWHAALMSFSMLGAAVAFAGVVGGVVLGLGNGPDYFRMFNIVILVTSAIGLWLILTRSVIWGTQPNARDRAVRLRFGSAALAASVALVLSQWWLLQ